MARGCRCGNHTCRCCVQSGQGTHVSGTGSSTDCYQVDVELSSEAQNGLRFGEDGGLYAASAGGQTTVTGGDGVTVEGDPSVGYQLAWAPGAAYAATEVATNCTTTNVYRAPATLATATSTAGTADVVDAGSGNLRITRPGLWEVTALLRFMAGAQEASLMYGEIVGLDTPCWGATPLPLTYGPTLYSVNVTVGGVVNVTSNKPAVIYAAGRRSLYAQQAQITAAVVTCKRLAPALPGAPAPFPDPPLLGSDGTGSGAEIDREHAEQAARSEG